MLSRQGEMRGDANMQRRRQMDDGGEKRKNGDRRDALLRIGEKYALVVCYFSLSPSSQRVFCLLNFR